MPAKALTPPYCIVYYTLLLKRLINHNISSDSAPQVQGLGILPARLSSREADWDGRLTRMGASPFNIPMDVFTRAEVS